MEARMLAVLRSPPSLTRPCPAASEQALPTAASPRVLAVLQAPPSFTRLDTALWHFRQHARWAAASRGRCRRWAWRRGCWWWWASASRRPHVVAAGGGGSSGGEALGAVPLWGPDQQAVRQLPASGRAGAGAQQQEREEELWTYPCRPAVGGSRRHDNKVGS